MGTPQLATAIADAGSFGTICLGSFADELLTINTSDRSHVSAFALTAVQCAYSVAVKT